MADWPLTRAELARRYSVHPSAITRALNAARAACDRDASLSAPPEPVNPDEPLKRWLPSVFDPWWKSRPRRGRPKTRRGEAA